jgi:hypothetical protein
LKIALAVLQESRQPMIRRMASTLINQLVELEPRLANQMAAEGLTPDPQLDSQGRPLSGGLPIKLFMPPPE